MTPYFFALIIEKPCESIVLALLSAIRFTTPGGQERSQKIYEYLVIFMLMM
jgi:hypothetical protein